MHFASRYLEKHSLYDNYILQEPHGDLQYIVVIPCYDEEGIVRTLQSLWEAYRPRHAVEVVVVVNASENDPPELIERNSKTREELVGWKNNHDEEAFCCHCIYVDDLHGDKAGAGLARKIGMDEAVARFNRLNRGGGFIISLDADTRVEKNYFRVIEKTLKENTKLNAGILYFEHPLDGEDFSPDLYEGIVRYELFLRYYNQALRWAGYPYAFQTIGSAFCVRAEAYTKQGGMNTRRAGEDFYFLNKIFQLGGVRDITETMVIPSPRPSSRVLFGTGPEMIRWLQDPTRSYLTYHPRVFQVLKQFLARTGDFFEIDGNRKNQVMKEIDPVMRDFLYQTGFERELQRINNNSNSLLTFRKHFMHWFNGLRIIRFIHHAHDKQWEKMPLDQAAKTLLGWMKEYVPDGYRQMLVQYRQMGKYSSWAI